MTLLTPTMSLTLTWFCQAMSSPTPIWLKIHNGECLYVRFIAFLPSGILRTDYQSVSETKMLINKQYHKAELIVYLSKREFAGKAQSFWTDWQKYEFWRLEDFLETWKGWSKLGKYCHLSALRNVFTDWLLSQVADFQKWETCKGYSLRCCLWLVKQI